MKRFCWLLLVLYWIAFVAAASADELIIMVRDQVNGGPAAFEDGDPLHIFDSDEIARQWAEVERLNQAGNWEGHPRDRAPLSQRVLSRFCVVSISAELQDEFEKWISQRQSTVIQDGEIVEIVLKKRTYTVDWRSVVPAEYHDEIENPDVAIDLRGIVTIETADAFSVKGVEP